MCKWLITQLISVKIVIKPVKFSLKSLLSWPGVLNLTGHVWPQHRLSSIGTEWTTEWAPFLRLAVSVLTTLNWRDPVALNKCFDSSTDYQIDVFGNVFFNYRTIESRTCNKKATHIPVSILIISRLNNHNLSTNWVVTAGDVLSVVRFAGSACGHFPVYASNMKPSVWWNNEVKSSEQ